jgi:deoxyribodipyrimidine photo-lyase
VKKSSLGLKIKSLDLKEVSAFLNKLSLDRRVGPVTQFFKGGTSQAKARLDEFIKKRFKHYVENRNQPQTDDISHMSPYLHFGQLSPLYLALQIKAAVSRLKKAQEAYLEELIVRRELAMNFINYTPNYDSYGCLSQWAQKTLKQHQTDKREYVYTRRQLEDAETHDEYWNAAMREMKITGFMHNYMRMYWGKKILEWSKTPQHAFRTTLADRAWFERPIFGKVRYMTASGLERKCDIQGYVRKVNALVK